MKIYNPNNQLLLDIAVSNSSFATDSIMNEDILSLEFEMTDYLEIPVDSYCRFRYKKYTLLKDSDFTKQSERDYRYKLMMYTDPSKSKDVKYGFATVTKNAGQLPKFDYAKKIDFNLTGKPIDFAQLWVDNMNIANAETGWTVGECIDAPMKTLDFSDQWCFDVLGQLSEAFETEWEFEGKKLHIRMVEKRKDSAFPLSYGMDNGLLKGVSRVNYNNGKTINRLIMKGSDRNIVFASYKDTKLHLPKNTRIKYDGNYFSDEPEFVDSANAIEYITDANGSYIERSDRTGRVKEDSLDCTSIYPMHEGTITSVDANNNLVFYDANNTIDYYDLLIPGNTMQLIPQSGDLIGKEFDVNYNHTNKRFKLKRIEGNNDVKYPSGNLIPRVGDKYAIFKIKLPQEYINKAELTALKKCVKYLYENEVPQYTFGGRLDPIYAQKHWSEISGYLYCGYFVHFSDHKFLPDGADIRITKVDCYVNAPLRLEITLSNKVVGKSFTNKQNKIDNQDQTIDRKNENTVSRLRASEYLQKALENNTTIDGGLILTSLIQLGFINESTGLFANTAGTNGISQSPDDVAFWGGGTLEQAINLVANPNATENVASFVVTHRGKVIQNQSFIRGRFESNANGNRIVIDPETRSFKMISPTNAVLAKHSFYSDTESGSSGASIELSGTHMKEQTNVYINNGRADFSSVSDGRSLSMGASGFTLSDKTGTARTMLTSDIAAFGQKEISLEGIPDNAQELSYKLMYYDENGFLKIKL